MKTWVQVFRLRPGLWVPPLALLALSLAALAVYRFNFASESVGVAERLAAREKQLQDVTAERRKLDAFVERAEVNRRLVDEFYRERLSTRRQRLTQVIEEVKTLARRAGLDPQSITYPEEPIEEFAVVERSFAFSVAGTYPELRNFINFLELSPSFLTLKKVALSGDKDGSGELAISLELATLFAVEPQGAASPGEEGQPST